MSHPPDDGPMPAPQVIAISSILADAYVQLARTCEEIANGPAATLGIKMALAERLTAIDKASHA